MEFDDEFIIRDSQIISRVALVHMKYEVMSYKYTTTVEPVSDIRGSTVHITFIRQVHLLHKITPTIKILMTSDAYLSGSVPNSVLTGLGSGLEMLPRIMCYKMMSNELAFVTLCEAGRIVTFYLRPICNCDSLFLTRYGGSLILLSNKM